MKGQVGVSASGLEPARWVKFEAASPKKPDRVSSANLTGGGGEPGKSHRGSVVNLTGSTPQALRKEKLGDLPKNATSPFQFRAQNCLPTCKRHGIHGLKDSLDSWPQMVGQNYPNKVGRPKKTPPGFGPFQFTVFVLNGNYQPKTVHLPKRREMKLGGDQASKTPYQHPVKKVVWIGGGRRQEMKFDQLSSTRIWTACFTPCFHLPPQHGSRIPQKGGLNYWFRAGFRIFTPYKGQGFKSPNLAAGHEVGALTENTPPCVCP